MARSSLPLTEKFFVIREAFDNGKRMPNVFLRLSDIDVVNIYVFVKRFFVVREAFDNGKRMPNVFLRLSDIDVVNIYVFVQR